MKWLIVFMLVSTNAMASVEISGSTVGLPPCVTDAQATLNRVVKVTGLPEDVIRIVVMDSGNEVCEEFRKWGGTEPCPQAFSMKDTVYINKFDISRKTLAHEFAHVLMPRLPKKIQEVIPNWTEDKL